MAWSDVRLFVVLACLAFLFCDGPDHRDLSDVIRDKIAGECR